MFYKKRIEELENKVNNLELELWKIKNPPKFKKCDKIKFYDNGDGIIIDIFVIKTSYGKFMMEYDVFDLNDGEVFRLSEFNIDHPKKRKLND